MFTVNANKYHVHTILVYCVFNHTLRNIKKNSILEIKNKMAAIWLEKM